MTNSSNKHHLYDFGSKIWHNIIVYASIYIIYETLKTNLLFICKAKRFL